MRSLRECYSDQKASAKARGIHFKLTFEQWLEIWNASGHLSERGKGADKYVMARHGDKGGYVVGNVKIVLGAENIAERRYKHSQEAKDKIAASRVGFRYSEESKRKISRAVKRSWLNR